MTASFAPSRTRSMPRDAGPRRAPAAPAGAIASQATAPGRARRRHADARRGDRADDELALAADVHQPGPRRDVTRERGQRDRDGARAIVCCSAPLLRSVDSTIVW